MKLGLATRMYAVATVDDNEVTEGAIFTLLDSIDSDLMTVLLVCRGVSQVGQESLAAHPAVCGLRLVGKMGLSSARNEGLSELVRLGVPDDVVVCFPDDDCYYPESALSCVSEHMSGPIDLLLGVYGEHDSAEHQAARALTYKDVFKHGNSVGIFARMSLVKAVGGFDQRMGVGSGEVPAAEDIEFLARCLSQRSVRALFDRRILVRHPISVGAPERSGAYLAVAIRYWRHRESWVRLLRTIGGSLLGKSPVPASRLIHLLRPRRRRGWGD